MADQHASDLPAITLPIVDTDVVIMSRDGTQLHDVPVSDLKTAMSSGMPSTLLNKGSQVLVVDGSEQNYKLSNLYKGAFNFKPTSYLRTRAALAACLAGKSNFNILHMVNADYSSLPSGFDYTFGVMSQLARRLGQFGLSAFAQSWIGSTSYSAVNDNTRDVRRSNAAPAWVKGGSNRAISGDAYYNTTTLDPLMFRPSDTNNAATYKIGAPLVCNKAEVFYADPASGTKDIFTMQGGVYDAPKTITAITKANPGVLTITGHGYSVGDTVLLECTGMTQFDGSQLVFVNNVVDANNIQVRLTGVASGGASVDTTAYGTFIAGTAKKITWTTAPEVPVFSNSGSVRKQTFTVAGAQVWRVQKAIAGSIADIRGLNFYNSATAVINLINAYVQSSVLAWNGTGNLSDFGQLVDGSANSGWCGGSATVTSKTPLAIISVSSAEAFANNQSTTQSHLITKINQLKAAGTDVLLVFDFAYNTSAIAQTLQDGVKYALYNAANATGVALLDVQQARKSFADAVNVGLINNTNSDNTVAGAMDTACLIANWLGGVLDDQAVKVENSTAPYVPIKLPFGLTNTTVNKTFFGIHQDSRVSGSLTPVGAFTYGSARTYTTGINWNTLEPQAGVYDWALLDSVILAYRAKGVNDIMLTLSSTPAHAVDQTWYNAQPAMARNTAYTVGNIRRPAVGNSCMYICTVAGTTGATAPNTYNGGAWAGQSASLDLPWNTFPVTRGNPARNSNDLIGNRNITNVRTSATTGDLTATTTVLDGTVVWQLIGDDFHDAYGAMPASRAASYSICAAIAARYNAVSAFNPTGLKMITRVEHKNEPNLLGTYSNYYWGTVQTLVNEVAGGVDGWYSVDTTALHYSPGFTNYNGFLDVTVPFMTTVETGGTGRRGCQLCDVMGWHPYNMVTSPNYTDVINETYFGAAIYKTKISQNAAGNNFRGNSVQTLPISITEWGLLSLNAVFAALPVQERYLAYRRFFAKLHLFGVRELYAFRADINIAGDFINDTNGLIKAWNDEMALFGSGANYSITNGFEYIDGTGRIERVIGGVSIVV